MFRFFYLFARLKFFKDFRSFSPPFAWGFKKEQNSHRKRQIWHRRLLALRTGDVRYRFYLTFIQTCPLGRRKYPTPHAPCNMIILSTAFWTQYLRLNWLLSWIWFPFVICCWSARYDVISYLSKIWVAGQRLFKYGQLSQVNTMYMKKKIMMMISMMKITKCQRC